MNDIDPDVMMLDAINGNSIFKSLCEVAIALRDYGKSQKEVEQIFDKYRMLHEGDKDETAYNAILDVMDLIAGWCSSEKGIFQK